MRGTASIVTSIAALLATVVAIASPATAAPTATAAAEHLPHFDLISRPTSLKGIPRILRFPFEHGLPKGARHGFRIGKMRLPEGTVTAVGNRRMICFEAKVGESGGGGCEHTQRILHRGLSVYSPCVEGTEEVRISGIVPNRITALGVDRHADGQIEEEIPVTGNAFIALLEPVGVVLHAIGPGAHGLTIRYPLGRLDREGQLCGGKHHGGVAASDGRSTTSAPDPGWDHEVGASGRPDELLATARGKGACGVAAARHGFAAFLDAFDHGDLRRLDSLFARGPAFKWFSAGAPGPPRFDRAASRRDTLIPYFRALHRRRYRLGLDWLRIDNGSQHSTGLAFELRGGMPGFRDGKWFPLAGKGNLLCLASGPKFRVFSLGPPGSGAAANMSDRL